MRTLRNALLWTLVLTTLLSPLTGCVLFYDVSGARVQMREAQIAAQNGAGEARRYLARVEGRDRDGNAYAVGFSPLRLIQPADVEAVWMPDPERRDESNGGKACVEADDLSIDTRQLLAFYNVCAVYVAAGVLGAGILYTTNWNGAQGQELFVPGQLEMGMRMTMVAGVLTFLVLQAGQYVALDQRSVNATGVLYFATGVALLAHAAAFYLLRAQLHEIGPLPVAASLEEQIAYQLGLTIFALMAAGAYMNGPTPEWALATAALLGVAVQLATVEQLLPGLPDDRTRRRAQRDLRKSEKQTGKALAAAEKQSQKKAIKKVLKAAGFAGRASHDVMPFLLTQGS